MSKPKENGGVGSIVIQIRLVPIDPQSPPEAFRVIEAEAAQASPPNDEESRALVIGVGAVPVDAGRDYRLESEVIEAGKRQLEKQTAELLAAQSSGEHGLDQSTVASERHLAIAKAAAAFRALFDLAVVRVRRVAANLADDISEVDRQSDDMTPAFRLVMRVVIRQLDRIAGRSSDG